VDGKFGVLTSRRVTDFQRAHALLVDGVVGPITWGALLGHLFLMGRTLYDTQGREVILRGINLPVLDDWNFPQSDGLDELVKTNANAVRVAWYVDYNSPTRPAYSTDDLDGLLTRCRAAQVIPIVGIWDGTCKADLGLLAGTIVPWWKSAAAKLNQHQKYLIVNLANELGFYGWDANPAKALKKFVDAYKSAITAVRQDLHVPIMIDAPDCGTRLDVWNAVGKELIDHDPDHNLLLSAHAYWAVQDWTPEIASAVASNLPIVFGEVANFQDDESPCQYSLDDANPPASGFTYQNLLKTLQNQKIGWLAWSWGPDQCDARRVTADGSFAGLTSYGSDLVHHPVYGWMSAAIKSHAFA
jgi:mannan endo-1,4-beta-mannosidase